MLQVYVFAAGGATTAVLNAVSAFMGTADFSSAMSISAFFSVIGCATLYIKSRDLTQFLKWFAIFFCVSFILVGVTTTVQVINMTNPMNVSFVDNVPYGIAMPASIITSLEAGLTQGISDIFHIPDDVSYDTTGMIFGAQLFNAVNNGAVIFDDATRNNFNHFVRQCIVPDILINHKYTFSQLANAPDILSFLSQQQMSPLRGIYINGQFETCQSAFPIISQEIQSNVDAQTSWIGSFLFHDRVVSGNELFSQIQNVYSYMMNLTDDASDILYQNTMINAIRSGIGTQMAKNNSAAALINYGYTSAMQKQLLADNTLARVASYMMPLSQTVFVLIMIGVFPIIALLALQPALFFSVLKNYIRSLIYLATWPPLFCIINFIMTTELSYHMSAIAQNQSGITISNQNELLYIAEQFAAYCGYLIALVPVIAGFIFRGLDAVLMNAAQTLVGNMQGWISSGATALAEGNVSLANTSIGNHSWNNWSANKHDTNYTDLHGMSTNQLGNGATVTTAPNGSQIYNTSSAMSQLATGVNAGALISSQLSKSYDHSMQLANQQSENFSRSLTQSWSDLVSFSDTHGITATQGHSYSVSNQTSASQAVSNIMGVVRDVAQRNNWSEQEAYNHLTGDNFNLSAHGGANFPKWGFASAGVNASLGVSRSHSNSYGTAHDSGASSAISTNEQQQFSENYSVLSSSASTLHSDQSSSHGLSGLSQIGSDLRESDSIGNQLSATLTQSNRYSAMLNYSESSNANVQDNLSQSFANYVEKTHPAEASSILGSAGSVAISEKRQALAESFVKSNYMSQFEKGFNASGSSMSSAYSSDSGAIANQSDSVVSNFMEQKNGVMSQERSYGIGNNTGNHIQSDVAAQRDYINDQISSDRNTVASSNAELKEGFSKSQNIGDQKLKSGNSWKADI